MERRQNMSILTAYYKFQLVPANKTDGYTIKKIGKAGNSPHFNDLFIYDKPVKYKIIWSNGIIDDYMVYPVSYATGHDDKRLLMFETASYLHPYGNINIAGSEDCTLFRISPDNTFEIFISADNANQTAQLLTMLIDGSLKDDIDELITKIENFNE
jgi:hypothetical protein